MSTTLRIHPAIGISRTGNSAEYVISPETSAGMPNGSNVSGGLPIVAGTESQHISDQDLRDSNGALKPNAQRFRIFAYADAPSSYPYKGEVSEVCVGCEVDGKTVESITWQVHMANKKCNNWIIPEHPSEHTDWNNGVGGMAHYADGDTPHVRNGDFGKSTYPVELNANDWGTGTDPKDVDMSDPVRLKNLVIDAGPKTINSKADAGGRVAFDKNACSYIDDSGNVQSVDYPQQWPSDNFSNLFVPGDFDFGSMGSMETDDKGRLLVIGSPGFGAAWMVGENNPGGSVDSPPAWDETPDTPFPPPGLDQPFPLWSDIDNDGWFDDAGDGPITAVLNFTDGSKRLIDVPAWCICADPGYAPQVRNVVTIWDEVYNSWLRDPQLQLDPSLYDTSSQSYNTDYKAAFEQDVWSIFRAAHLQMFTTDLNQKAIGSHQRVNDIKGTDDPKRYLNIKNFIRDPNTGPDNQLETGAPLMPLSLGDTGASFLTVTHTQYFFLEQWYDGNFNDDKESLSPGELLDKNTLTNLLGGRFSPGIDLTFIVRDPYLYNQDWKSADVGPFRIGGKKLDYGSATPDKIFLSVGYTPNRTEENPVEPGDLCKFMALPWHTDYNSCATHQPSPNPGATSTQPANTTLFWSWPAQRPVSVYTYEDYHQNNNSFYAEQRFSVRGAGTQWTGDSKDPEMANGPSSVGRYQERLDMLKNWFNIGVVIQGPAIEGFEGPNADLFLEVKSQLDGPSDWSQPWPILTTDKVFPEKDGAGGNG